MAENTKDVTSSSDLLLRFLDQMESTEGFLDDDCAQLRDAVAEKVIRDRIKQVFERMDADESSKETAR
jgi:hypothetical protein